MNIFVLIVKNYDCVDDKHFVEMTKAFKSFDEAKSFMTNAYNDSVKSLKKEFGKRYNEVVEADLSYDKARIVDSEEGEFGVTWEIISVDVDF